MFHLTGKIYLEHKRWYNTKYPSIILFENEGPHPASNLPNSKDYPFPTIKGLEDFLQKNHNGSEQEFWGNVISNNKKKHLVIYLDDALFLRFQTQYWKSIFENINAKEAYLLHKFYYTDYRLKKFLHTDRADAQNTDRKFQDYQLLEFEQYEKHYNDAQIINAFKDMNKGDVSFEYLLGDYFYNKKSKHSSFFRTKLKKLCWKIWFNEMEILRSELINSFYDIKKVIPNASFNIEDPLTIEAFIVSEPLIRWLEDPDFNESNIDYVKDNYDPNTFIKLIKDFRGQWDIKINSEDKDILNKIEIYDSVLPINLLFEENYFEILNQNIEKNFGCRFVDELLRNKANQILPSYIYDLARNNNTKDLFFLELRGGKY